MALVEEIERIIDERMNDRLKEFDRLMSAKPFVEMDVVVEKLGKKPRWIRDNLCTVEQIDEGLVQKVGGEWHFLNPEFFEYVHDVWWPNYKKG